MAPRVTRENDSIAIRLPMQRTGAAAFVGTVHLELIDALGKSVERSEVAVAVFGGANPRVALPVRGLPAGNYRLRIEARTERTGVASGTLVMATPIRAEFAVVL